MEQNKFEGLEEIEPDMSGKGKEEVVLKQYEKLLLTEQDRADYEKAVELISYGCFEQKQETTFDFNNVEIIRNKKKYKGLYQLYRNLDTMQMMFVCPLIENNKGDADGEKKDLAPYAYDVIYVEQMDAETYELVRKAAKNNISSLVKVLYYSVWVAYLINFAVGLTNFIYQMIYQLDAGSDFWASFNAASGLFGAGFNMIGTIVALPIMVLMVIKYKKYKEQ